ncbi:anti-sigma factor family protein, partial [Corallococcus exercitus]
MNAHCTRLPAFVDGELPLEHHEGFRAHLVSCVACGVRFHDLLQADILGRLALAKAAPTHEATADSPAPWSVPFEPADVRVPPPRRGRPHWSHLGALALALALVGIGAARVPRDAPTP